MTGGSCRGAAPLLGDRGSFLEDHGKGSANLGRFLVADFS